MAESEHLETLQWGVELWNAWRREHSEIKPDLTVSQLSRLDLRGANLSRCNLEGAHLNATLLDGADLTRANLGNSTLRGASLHQAKLSEANLAGANLSAAVFTEADLRYANLSSAHAAGANFMSAVLTGADLSRSNLYEVDLRQTKLNAAKLRWANMTRTDLRQATLRRAELMGVSLIDADLSGADFRWANLSYARIIDTRLDGADLTECRVYGISAWNLQLAEAKQSDLIITPPDEPKITVDDLDMAQFVYVLLNSAKIRRTITTLTSKVVLILGRFTPERMEILQALRDTLRNRDYLPILYDFTSSSSRDLTETISTLAHLSRFVIADLTDAKSIPQELMAIVPNLPSVPVQPLLWAGQPEYAMFEHFRRYPWVLSTFVYKDMPTLLQCMDEKVIAPAEKRSRT